VLKARATYEIMSPAMVGLDGSRLVLGKHSGRHAVRSRLAELGHPLDEPALDAVFARFKEIADRKKSLDDRDLEALVASRGAARPGAYALAMVQATCGTHAEPSATVGLRVADGETVFGSARGDGPVDAVCRAIARLTGELAELEEFAVDAITEGVDAAGGVQLRLREKEGGRVYSGYAVHTDIVVAAGEAYVAAVNAMLRGRDPTRAAARSAAHALPEPRPTTMPEVVA
jgi:2-isopropylmalate synthase